MSHSPPTASALDPFAESEAFTVAEAARLARTNRQTVVRWLRGYQAFGRTMAPIFSKEPRQFDDPRGIRLSFLELIEIFVAARFRSISDQGVAVPLDRVRKAHTYMREQLGIPYPFASEHLWQSGPDIMADFAEQEPGLGTLAVTRGGQWVFPEVVEHERHHIEYENDFAARWYPFGTEIPIIINPHVQGGRWTIPGTRVTVDTIVARWRAGDSADYLAADYGIGKRVINTVLDLAA